MRSSRPLCVLFIAAAAVLPTAASGAVAATCFGETPTITGSPGADVLLGDAADNVILARGGNDRIYGRGGADLICAGPGDDVVSGDSGGTRSGPVTRKGRRNASEQLSAKAGKGGKRCASTSPPMAPCASDSQSGA